MSDNSYIDYFDRMMSGAFSAEAPVEKSTDSSQESTPAPGASYFDTLENVQPMPSEQIPAPGPETSVDASAYFDSPYAVNNAQVEIPQEQVPAEPSFDIGNYADSFYGEQPMEPSPGIKFEPVESYETPAYSHSQGDVPTEPAQSQDKSYIESEPPEVRLEGEVGIEELIVPAEGVAAGVSEQPVEEDEPKNKTISFIVLICACLMILIGIGIFLSDKVQQAEELLVPEESIENLVQTTFDE